MNQMMRQPFLIKMLREIGRHEAGHYVIGRSLGFKMSDIKITIFNLRGDHFGGTAVNLPQAVVTMDAVRKYAENRVQMLYAGSLAQTLKSSTINHVVALDILKNRGGKSDFEKAGELVNLIRNIKHPGDRTNNEVRSHLDSIDKEMWRCAKDLVKQEAHTIIGLGRKVAETVKEFCVEYTITVSEINRVPVIISRFQF